MSSSTSRSRSPANSASAAGTIFWSGFVVGVLDLTWAIVHTLIRHGNPLAMFRFIAGGLLGPDAIKGGVGISILGMALHFVIAFGAAAVFYALSRGMPWLLRQPILAGLCYGLVVWLVMNLVVLRYSAWHATKFPPANWVPTFIAHFVCVGLPIALIIARLSPPTAWRRTSQV